MANFYFQGTVRLCDILSMPCEDCPLGHILDGSADCPVFDCTDDARKFLSCLRNTSDHLLTDMAKLLDG